MLAGPFHRKLHLNRFWKEVSASSKQTTGGKALQSVARCMREQGTSRQKLGVAEGGKAGHSGWGQIAKDECPARRWDFILQAGSGRYDLCWRQRGG